MSSPLSTIITREDLAKLSIVQPEDKDKTVSMMAQSYKRDILSYNSKGVTHAVLSVYDERPEIHTKVLEKMKEIFVDSKIRLETTGSGYKNLAVNWGLTDAEKHQLAVLANQKATEEYRVAVLEEKANEKAMEENRKAILANQKAMEANQNRAEEHADAETDSDSESDSDSDDDPLKVHIVLSEPGNAHYKHETVFMIMVLTMVMSVAGSWIIVISQM
jgi:hypothetical protein